MHYEHRLRRIEEEIKKKTAKATIMVKLYWDDDRDKILNAAHKKYGNDGLVLGIIQFSDRPPGQPVEVEGELLELE